MGKKIAQFSLKNFRFKLSRVYTSLRSLIELTRVELVKHFDFTINRVYLRTKTILIPKNVNSASQHSICGTLRLRLMCLYFIFLKYQVDCCVSHTSRVTSFGICADLMLR